jgi:exosortase F-associated protein
MLPGKTILRIIIAVIAGIGLVVVFLFQRTDLAAYAGIEHRFTTFVVNRSLRFIFNDFFAIGLIYALFANRKYVVFALWVQLAGIALILIPYFAIKYFCGSYNGPLISFLHRLIMNPILILLLIPAFYYQQKTDRESQDNSL